jgi:hypothetical protein
MTDDTYELIIANVTGDAPDLVREELRKLSREELDEVFERATREQEAREDLREMIVRLWTGPRT